LIESSASAVTGLMIATIACLVGALIGWLAWAQVEEVVRAPGRVEPVGRVKIVNHPQGGRVAAVHVRDGDRVRSGQPLLTLDSELEASESAELLGRWQVQAAEAARLEAEESGKPLILDEALAAARPDLAMAAEQVLAARHDALASRRDAATKQVQMRRGELDTAAAEVGRLRNRLTLLRQERDAVRELAERGLYPNLKLIAIERQTSDAAGDLKKAEAALAAAKAGAAESQSRLASVEREWRSSLLDELGRATAERDRLAEQLKGQTTRQANSVIRAAVDGVVQDLAVAGTGQAVAANETLMRIMPTDEAVVVEARVANEDIGRLMPGLPARVKVRAFDYARYGTLDGTIQRVAADATPDKSGILAYIVTVATQRQRLGEAPGDNEIVPGMVVDVELKVGERTILSYLTERIVRFGEAFSES
jgi:HlyD family type I secretion membrane fusion protein